MVGASLLLQMRESSVRLLVVVAVLVSSVPLAAVFSGAEEAEGRNWRRALVGQMREGISQGRQEGGLRAVEVSLVGLS